MSNGKKLTLFAVLTALVIVAGIVMYALFGYHYTSDYKTLEVTYDAIVTISEKEESLESLCENEISKQGLKYSQKQTSVVRDTTSIGETGDKLLTYTFSSKTDETKLTKIAEAIRTSVKSSYADADIYVSVHAGEGTGFYEAAWRGAVALAVAAVVALIYAAIRYGFANAISALIAAASGALLSAAIFAIVPIPVYAYSPLLYAGIAAVVTLVLWFLQSARMRASFKESDSAALTAEEAVKKACRESRKTLLLFVVPVAVVFILLGAVATSGARLFFLPALVALAVSLFAAMLLGPCVLVPLKEKFDRIKVGRKRYVGKKKADAEE